MGRAASTPGSPERQFGGVAPAERPNVSGYVNKEGEVNGRAARARSAARQMRSSVSRSMSAKSYARSPARLGDCAASAVIDLRVWATPLLTNVGEDRGQLPAFDDAAAQGIRWRMPIPDYQTLMLPVLRILGDGADHTAALGH